MQGIFTKEVNQKPIELSRNNDDEVITLSDSEEKLSDYEDQSENLKITAIFSLKKTPEVITLDFENDAETKADTECLIISD